MRRGTFLLRRHFPAHPVGDHSGNFQIVFLVHEEMTVAVDADVGKPNEVVLDAEPA
jgi:hypothetical protein